MQCIGDECHSPRGSSQPPVLRHRVPLLRSVAIGALCAGLGYVSANPRRADTPQLHIAAMAPPLVMVSEIGD